MKDYLEKLGNCKTLDQINLVLKQSDNNYKSKKEKVWEFRSTLKKNTPNIKKFLTKKNEENNKLKENIKDLIAPNFKINKKSET